jgi:hypothetical protein
MEQFGELREQNNRLADSLTRKDVHIKTLERQVKDLQKFDKSTHSKFSGVNKSETQGSTKPLEEKMQKMEAEKAKLQKTLANERLLNNEMKR